MFTKSWQIIKDDSKKTFEPCGQEFNTNYFTNFVYGMQKAGMNVSCITPPVTNTNSNKESIKITGYTKEAGLYDRLMKQYQEINMRAIDDFE
ncbi:MAG TPA: hypothetical protein VGK59_11130 [Ohtaekwangia sp.]